MRFSDYLVWKKEIYYKRIKNIKDKFVKIINEEETGRL